MSALRTESVKSFDGAELAVHRLGEGRPVLLLHGLFSSAHMNWIDFGHAAQLAEAGFEAIMPDLRAHGASAAPQDAEAYPKGVLIRDLEALIAGLGLFDFDLVGFSLGARTAAEGVIEGVRPRRLALAGMGLEGLTGWARRSAFFLDAIDRFDSVRPGDPAFFAVSFMRKMKVDRVAARLLLEAVEDVSVGELGKIAMPAAVICGDKDRDNGSPTALADRLPQGTYEEIPGTHMSCVSRPELGDAIKRFLLLD